MDLRGKRLTERSLVKTKIIATIGPACESTEMLTALIGAGVDVFRLNFAHGDHAWFHKVVGMIRQIAAELEHPVGIMGDLSGPKIRLGTLPEGGLFCGQGERIVIARHADPAESATLTSTYKPLVDDLKPGDNVLLADGTVRLRVVEKEGTDRVICEVEQPGLLRTRQGINLPGVALSTPAVTEKDRTDLAWAIRHELDFVSLSFVRSAEDIQLLREAMAESGSARLPHVISKIEKMEAVSDIERILDETDAVMVARGDLGVEVDVARVPLLQKRIIRLCNQHRIPVITATQMLDSMQENERPTRAEASDVANAVLDGSDAVMLSGETAIGEYPVQAVDIMSRIAQEAERLVATTRFGDRHSQERTRATVTTEAVTLGATSAAEHLDADMIVVATHSGRTAMAVSKQRSPVPILALTDRFETARRMCLYWGVTPVKTDAVHAPADALIEFVTDWGKRNHVLESGSRVILVGSTDWSRDGKDVMMVHTVE
ncbi:MAG: pyruvate kinase [Planctomycetaceae bacterium]|jgi:pyruvate kinase|nr:pyruvate kinase [Planctomycetaceae bacterium]MBT6487751.1 pyruvate kinase [Planctomycetaceae bacterium]